jgi:hypothetical protein
LQPQLSAVLARIENREVGELMREVFQDLTRLLGYLDGVGAAVRPGGSAEEARFLLDVIRSEALAMACGLDSSCGDAELPAELSEELERTCFALRHELKTVSERILPGPETEAEEARARLKDAHDLLRNCFQQSTIALARVFDPALDGAHLFRDLRAKRDNSLRLYEDLSALLRITRHALWRGDEDARRLFAERLEDFRNGSMQHLMQKDCDACLGFIADFDAARRTGGMSLFLHRFSCYLELLLKHVSMRSVLADAAQELAA